MPSPSHCKPGDKVCCTSGGPCKAIPPCKGNVKDDTKMQEFGAPSGICEHLNAFHVYAEDESRFVETNHYCTHLTPEFRQCILYDGPQKGARLIGVEYMCTPELFATFPEDEKRLWHSHVYEVKSGMLVLPRPTFITEEEWTKAETAAMGSVITLYGKTYHFWQIDRLNAGHPYPFGPPSLMMSFTHPGQFDFAKHVGDRDKRFGCDYRYKAEQRKGIREPEIDDVVDVHRKKKGYTYIGKDRPLQNVTEVRTMAVTVLAVGGLLAWYLGGKTRL